MDGVRSARAGGSHVAHLVGELVDREPMPEGRVTDFRTTAAVHGEPVAGSFGDDLHGPPGDSRFPADDRGQASGMRGTDGHARAQTSTGEGCPVLIGDQASVVDGHHVAGRTRRLLGVAGGEEHGSTPLGVGPQHAVQPVGLPRRQALHRVVQEERVRVTEQRAGERQPAVHAEESRPMRWSPKPARPTASSSSSARDTGAPATAQSMRSCPRTVRAGCPGTSPSTTPTSPAGRRTRCSGLPRK